MLALPNVLGARFPFEELAADNLFEKELIDSRSVSESSESNHAISTSTPESSEVTQAEDPLCGSMYRMEEAIPLCMGYVKWDVPGIIRASFSLHFLQNLCFDQESIRRCVHDRLDKANCPLNPEIKALYQRNFDYCDGEYIPLAVQIFLEANYKVSISQSCMDVLDIHEMCDQNKQYGRWRTIPELINVRNRKSSITFLICDRLGLEMIRSETVEILRGLDENIRSLKSQLIKVIDDTPDFWRLDSDIDCLSEYDLTQFVPACNMTKKQALGVAIASLPVYRTIGMEGYYLFEKFMRINKDQ